MTAFDLAKVRLGDLLVGIGPKNTRSFPSNEKFALWSMGTYPKPLFPSDGEKESSLKKDDIRDALKSLKEPKNKDSSTDFVAVIEEFEDNYPDYLPQNPKLAPKDRIVVITILSDFIHDVKNKAYYRDRAAKIEEDWSALEDKIRYHSHANIVANLIVLTRSGQVKQPRLKTHRQIIRPYKEHFPSSKLSSNPIAEDVENHLLYPPMCSQSSIDFYYEGQRFISDFTLHIDEEVMKENRHFDLTIEIPKQPGANLRWGLLYDDDGMGKRSFMEIGWIGSNGEIFLKNKLKPNERVHLAPLDHSSQLGDKTLSAKFTSSTLRRVYHVDIRFTKVMPAWYAKIIIVFHAILVVLFVVLIVQIVQGAQRLINKWKEKVVVPDKGPT